MPRRPKQCHSFSPRPPRSRRAFARACSWVAAHRIFVGWLPASPQTGPSRVRCARRRPCRWAEGATAATRTLAGGRTTGVSRGTSKHCRPAEGRHISRHFHLGNSRGVSSHPFRLDSPRRVRARGRCQRAPRTRTEGTAANSKAKRRYVTSTHTSRSEPINASLEELRVKRVGLGHFSSSRPFGFDFGSGDRPHCSSGRFGIPPLPCCWARIARNCAIFASSAAWWAWSFAETCSLRAS